MDWPADIPAASYDQLRNKLLRGELVLGVAKDHGKNWWTFGAESKGRRVAGLLSLLPIVVGVVVLGVIVWTQNWFWLIALPLGFLTIFFGSPMNPGRRLAVVFGLVLMGLGSLSGWSSLVFSGVVVLVMYAQAQFYYGIGKKKFRRFLLTGGPEGFAKYWDARMVMLQDAESGETYLHELSEDEFRERLASTALAER